MAGVGGQPSTPCHNCYALLKSAVRQQYRAAGHGVHVQLPAPHSMHSNANDTNGRNTWLLMIAEQMCTNGATQS